MNAPYEENACGRFVQSPLRKDEKTDTSFGFDPCDVSVSLFILRVQLLEFFDLLAQQVVIEGAVNF